jgi:hypothetical protein
MSYPTKAKGFRSIIVEGVQYRWCFRSGSDDSRVTLQGSESGGQQAVVVLPGVRDPWLAVSDGGAKVTTVSPKIVRRMIQHALSVGWQPARRGAPVRFDFSVT